MPKKLNVSKWFFVRLAILLLVGTISFVLIVTIFAEDKVHKGRVAYWSADNVREYTKIPLENHVVTQKFIADDDELEEFVMLLDEHSPEDQAVLHVEMTDQQGNSLYELQMPTAEVVSEFYYIIGMPTEKLVAGEEYTFTLELTTPGSDIVVWAVESPSNSEKFTTMTLDGEELEQTDMYINVKYERSFSWTAYWIVYMIIVLGFFFVIEFTESKAVWRACHILLYILMYAVSYINIEHLSGNFYGIGMKYAVLNGLILAAIICIGHSILKKGAFYLGAILALLFGIANFYVMQFRGSELLLRDIKSFSTAMTVASDYPFSFPLALYLGIAGVVCLLLLKLSSDIKQRKFNKNGEPKKVSLKWNIIGRVAYAGLGIWLLLFVDSFVTKASFNFYAFSGNFSQYGWCYANAVLLKYSRVEVPENYSANRVQEIIDRVEEVKEDKKKIVPQNIIVIMNESFSDLGVLGELPTEDEVIPYFKSLSKNAVKGNLHVSVLGGNTCVSEWEFLTGNTEHFLPAGSVAYSGIKDEKEESLCYTLDKQGYYSVAMHPYIRDNWNRTNAYEALGFDEFLDIDAYENPAQLRHYVSDEADYDKIIDYYENFDKDKKLFVFNVTMQNHGGYSELNGNLDKTITLTGDESWEEVETYLSLIRESDKALEHLLDYFSQVEEPTMILFFGDHQPNVPASFLDAISGKSKEDRTTEDDSYQMMTKYFLWTNYDSDFTQYDNLSANYLSSYLLDCAGLDMPLYQQFLLQQMEEIPVVGRYGIYDEAGKFIDYDLVSPETLLDYRILQYMRLEDRNSSNYYIFSDVE